MLIYVTDKFGSIKVIKRKPVEHKLRLYWLNVG